MEIKFIDVKEYSVACSDLIVDFSNWDDFIWYLCPLDAKGKNLPLVLFRLDGYAHHFMPQDKLWFRCKIPVGVI